MIKDNIWLIGTGLMAIEYAKVLNALGCAYTVIGRGEQNSKIFLETTGVSPLTGGIGCFLKTKPGIPKAVINAVGIEDLSVTTQTLIQYGVNYLLLEKPGFAYPEEFHKTIALVNAKNAIVFLAYNRRFYASVLKAQDIIKADGGVTSFFFEFTEWSHVVGSLKKSKAEHENWFYGNSSHVIDAAFYLGGIPKEISTYKKGSILWHPNGSIYAGSGITENDALFSYIANWEAPGRWGIEICTHLHRLILRPMENLQIMNIGSVQIEFVPDIDFSFDQQFKPGLYLQVQKFLMKDTEKFCEIINSNFDILKRIN